MTGDPTRAKIDELRASLVTAVAVNSKTIQRLAKAEATVWRLTEALRGLLLSADCSWEEQGGGHDWPEACEEARAALATVAPTPEPPAAEPCPACNDDGVVHDMAGNALGLCDACEPAPAAEPPDEPLYIIGTDIADGHIHIVVARGDGSTTTLVAEERVPIPAAEPAQPCPECAVRASCFAKDADGKWWNVTMRDGEPDSAHDHAGRIMKAYRDSFVRWASAGGLMLELQATDDALTAAREAQRVAEEERREMGERLATACVEMAEARRERDETLAAWRAAGRRNAELCQRFIAEKEAEQAAHEETHRERNLAREQRDRYCRDLATERAAREEAERQRWVLVEQNAEMREAQIERDELRIGHANLRSHRDALQRQLADTARTHTEAHEAAHRKADALRRALVKFGKHKRDCRGPCSCGLDAALADTTEPPKPGRALLDAARKDAEEHPERWSKADFDELVDALSEPPGATEETPDVVHQEFMCARRGILLRHALCGADPGPLRATTGDVTCHVCLKEMRKSK
jgi:hypothetical protein